MKMENNPSQLADQEPPDFIIFKVKTFIQRELRERAFAGKKETN